MGASQSTSQGDSGSNSTATKTCYYELIGVNSDASETDIKKAYRKRALELHPDRNFGDAAAATQKFAELQSAYEVLSDPHERAWYDSHRDAILSGQDITGDGTEPTSFRNVRITSADEIISLIRNFNSTVPFSDDPNGFFTIARETFEHLALEEEVAAEQENVDAAYYATFGQADDSYNDIVKPFYTSWAGFATKKTFAWKDKYRLSDAPDRHTRRLMDKANKKLREDAAREFNDAVRFLVTFVRKRDPRYIPNTQTESQRQAASRVAASAQAARDRAANQERMANYKLPDWAASRESHSDEEFPLSEVESEVEILECVVCDKTFRSEKQLEAHERSKKHLKAVQQLRWQMRKEGVELQLNENSPQVGDTKATLQDGDFSDALSSPGQAGTPSPISSHAYTDINCEPHQSAPSSADDDDYAPRETVVDRVVNSQSVDTAAPQPLHTRHSIDGLSASTSAMDIGLGDRPRKVRNAKAKRERMAAAAQTNTISNHTCAVCREEFDSRTKLFAHIRTEDHAAAPRGEIPKRRKKKNG